MRVISLRPLCCRVSVCARTALGREGCIAPVAKAVQKIAPLRERVRKRDRRDYRPAAVAADGGLSTPRWYCKSRSKES